MSMSLINMFLIRKPRNCWLVYVILVYVKLQNCMSSPGLSLHALGGIPPLYCSTISKYLRDSAKYLGWQGFLTPLCFTCQLLPYTLSFFSLLFYVCAVCYAADGVFCFPFVSEVLPGKDLTLARSYFVGIQRNAAVIPATIVQLVGSAANVPARWTF